MKEIVLSRGLAALIDDEDWSLVSKYKWWAAPAWHTFYAKTDGRRPDGSRFKLRMHRLLLMPPDGLEVDHINGDGLDNRRENLRLATHAENSRNLRMPSTNSSGLKGASWHKAAQKWRSRIIINGQDIHLGLFLTAEAAHAAYCVASAKYHGEFGKTA